MRALALMLLAGCQPSQPATSLTDQQITAELVDAGCFPGNASDLAAVHAERAKDPPAAWMDCLAGGGTVAGCTVPCTR
ncbi:MAG TPA: hypothetical protein VNV25_25180 [Gemmatimonadaceae bacterium]|jgi:hypothetical protein|nr:hypothetical protein [Gemmatimonadaceae bacterium]